jgi:hypothetical protein
MSFRRATAVIVVLLLVALAGGCGGGASPFSTTTSSTEETTTSEASTTTVAPTTTTLGPTTTAGPITTEATTTTEPPFACPGMGVGGVPAGATDVSIVPANLDGDAIPDDAIAYQDGGVWYLHVRLGPGYTANLALDAAWEASTGITGVGPVSVVSARNLGDPRQVVVAVVSVGLAVQYALFAVESCQIVTLTQADGTVPTLWNLGSPAHSDFPVCGPGNTVIQAVFGAFPPCTDIYTCATPELSGDEYRVLRDPGRIEHVGSISRASTDLEMADMASRACMNP